MTRLGESGPYQLRMLLLSIAYDYFFTKGVACPTLLALLNNPQFQALIKLETVPAAAGQERRAFTLFYSAPPDNLDPHLDQDRYIFSRQ